MSIQRLWAQLPCKTSSHDKSHRNPSDGILIVKNRHEWQDFALVSSGPSEGPIYYNLTAAPYLISIWGVLGLKNGFRIDLIREKHTHSGNVSRAKWAQLGPKFSENF